MNEARTQLFDVAIVGYGPTGATLANLLAKCDLSVVVIERNEVMYHLPRAVHFDDETMRIFQTVGVADPLSEKIRVNPGMRFVDCKKSVILEWPRPQEIGPQGWHASYRLHQPDLEQLLRVKLSGYSNAVVLNGTEVVNIEQHAKNVRLLCRDITDGHEHSLNAKYLVGCDGANSLVRSTIGSDVDDLGFNERWLVVDLLLKRERPDLGDYSIQFCDPVRPMTYCRNPAKRRRWEITMLEGETHEEVTRSDTIWKFLTPWVTAEDAELERAAVYTFQSVVANNWRKDRLLIAGDAAHLTPPFMGQGMCAGIRDAANLAWKLALCIKGAANEDILDSYQQERSPHVRAFIEMAIRLGGLINTIDSRTALAQAESNAEGTARISSITPPLGASDLGELISSNRPHCGYLFSQPILRDGQRLDDKVGYCPVLILRHPLHENITPVVSVLDAEEHPNLATALDGLNTNAVLVRPDRYIAGSAIFENDIVDMAVTGLPSPISVTKEREPTL